MKTYNKKNYFLLFIIGSIVGGMSFFFLFPIEILNPTNIIFKLYEDPAQHFLGWHFFRCEPWHFPIGTIKSLLYPQGTSIVYTDSIPLFAIFFKIFSKFLSKNFQYLGIWILFCYILQGGFASLLIYDFIVKRTNLNILIVIPLTLLFVTNPVMYFRTFGHEALAAHWLIIAAIYLYFFCEKLFLWILLIITSLMVHFYIFGMIFFIFIAYTLKKYWIERKNLKLIIYSISLISIISILTMWIVGYFIISFKNGITSYGFSQFSMNLNSLFNSRNYFILPGLPWKYFEQYEGFNYLGLGMLLMFFVSIIMFIILLFKKKFQIKREYFPYLLILLFLFIYSLSDKITFNNTLLLKYHLPKFLKIFRACGRMFWPVYYSIFLFSIYIISKYFKKKIGYIFIILSISIQFFDLFKFYLPNKNFYLFNNIKKIKYKIQNLSFDISKKIDNPSNIIKWDYIINKVNKINFIQPTVYVEDFSEIIPIAVLSGYYCKKINSFYVARYDRNKFKNYKKKLIDDFKQGHLKDDTLYIIRNGYFYDTFDKNKYNYGMLDNYPIIVSKNILNKKLPPWPFTVSLNCDNFTLVDIVKNYFKKPYIVLLSVRDEAKKNLPYKFINMMKLLGSNIEKLKFRGSYAAIIKDGDIIKEKVSNNSEVLINYKFLIKNREYFIMNKSAGCNLGNISEIKINNIDFSLNRRGLNIVIFNYLNKQIMRFNFDTYKYINHKVSCE